VKPKAAWPIPPASCPARPLAHRQRPSFARRRPAVHAPFCSSRQMRPLSAPPPNPAAARPELGQLLQLRAAGSALPRLRVARQTPISAAAPCAKSRCSRPPAMSDIAPRLRCEPPKTLASRKCRAENRLGHHNPLLAFGEVIQEPTESAREVERERGCQWPSSSPHWRPSVLPGGGHVFSPLVATSSPRGVGVRGVSMERRP